MQLNKVLKGLMIRSACNGRIAACSSKNTGNDQSEGMIVPAPVWTRTAMATCPLKSKKRVFKMQQLQQG